MLGHKGFASRTSYFGHGNTDTAYPLPPQCKPSFFWGLVRHGARIPNRDDVEDWFHHLPGLRNRILEASARGESKIEIPVLQYIDEWTFNFTLDHAEDLTEAGWQEHQTMGERWNTRLANFFKPHATEIRSSHKQRCVDSGRAYTKGLFGNEIEVPVVDPMARFYDYCPAFLDNERKKAPIETAILEDLTFESVRMDVLSTTGVSMTTDELVSIWSICRYETAWSEGVTSQWCELFNKTSLEAFEFREDLGYYHSIGNPHDELILNTTQPLWRDLISRLEEVKYGGEVENSTVLTFVHSSATNPFMGTLGLYKAPEEMQAVDWPAKDRLWKMSEIGCFSTNFVLIVADCDGEENEDKSERKPEPRKISLFKEPAQNKKIFLFHQEKQIPFPSGVEDLQHFIDEYGHWAEKDFEETCTIKKHPQYLQTKLFEMPS